MATLDNIMDYLADCNFTSKVYSGTITTSGGSGYGNLYYNDLTIDSDNIVSIVVRSGQSNRPVFVTRTSNKALRVWSPVNNTTYRILVVFNDVFGSEN